MAFRTGHPEMRPGEVFMGNLWACDFAAVGWQTKRMGTVALDASGKRLKEFRPVFVAQAEVEAAGGPIPASGPLDHRW